MAGVGARGPQSAGAPAAPPPPNATSAPLASSDTPAAQRLRPAPRAEQPSHDHTAKHITRLGRTRVTAARAPAAGIGCSPCPFPTSSASSSPPPARRATRTAPAAVFTQAGRAFTDDVTVDVMGSAVVRVPGTTAGAPFLAVVGHIDEIGLIVTHIDDDGFLRFVGVGGWDAQILVGQRAELDTRTARSRASSGARRSTCCARRTARRCPSSASCTSTSARATASEARELVRIGDVAVIAGEPARATERPLHLARDGQPARRLHRARGGAPGRGGRAARRATSRPAASCRRRSASTARAPPRSRSSPTSRSSSTSPTRPARPASRSTRSAAHRSARVR